MPGSYSLTEQATPYTWVDGKTIYQKTIEVTLSTGETNVNHGISNIDKVIDAKCRQVLSSGTTAFFPSMANTSGGNFMAIWTVTRTQVKFFTSIVFDNSTYVTLWYTKSN